MRGLVGWKIEAVAIYYFSDEFTRRSSDWYLSECWLYRISDLFIILFDSDIELFIYMYIYYARIFDSDNGLVLIQTKSKYYKWQLYIFIINKSNICKQFSKCKKVC